MSFTDLGLPDADELVTKSNLEIAFGETIKERGLTQLQAAELIGVDQSKILKIVRGRLREFSTEGLLNYLMLLDQILIS